MSGRRMAAAVPAVLIVALIACVFFFQLRSGENRGGGGDGRRPRPSHVSGSEGSASDPTPPAGGSASAVARALRDPETSPADRLRLIRRAGEEKVKDAADALRE
ncbi:MAG: hypothetical protein ACYTGB_01625, partial [Planctomycetota bacterium]